MKKTILIGATGLAFSAAMLGFGFYSGQRPMAANAAEVATAAGPAVMDRAAIEQIVREYLIANPEVMVEVQEALEAKQQAAQHASQRDAIASAKDEIFNAAYDGTIGNPNGDTTLVEFFDYNCGYCKRAVGDMDALVASDPNLRVVLKEFPILGPDSQKAHIVSMAFKSVMPEHWGEFQRKLMGASGKAGEASAMQLAVSLGASEADMRKAMANPAILEAFNATYELANRLAITGTPSYVVGNEVVFGALGKAVLAEKVAAARAE